MSSLIFGAQRSAGPAGSLDDLKSNLIRSVALSRGGLKANTRSISVGRVGFRSSSPGWTRCLAHQAGFTAHSSSVKGMHRFARERAAFPKNAGSRQTPQSRSLVGWVKKHSQETAPIVKSCIRDVDRAAVSDSRIGTLRACRSAFEVTPFHHALLGRRSCESPRRSPSRFPRC